MPTTQILPADAAGIALASQLLKGGELVAMPTETVYGLAANALDAEAVQRIFAAKGRPADDPLIVHLSLQAGLSPAQQLEAWAQRGMVDATALSTSQARSVALLMQAFWPGPLTMLLPRGVALPPAVTSGSALVALRVPAHPQAAALLAATGLPLAAPSANRFGRISPTTAADVLDELDGRLPLILDGGACAHGIESTIVSFDAAGHCSVLRPGAISAEALQHCLGEAPRLRTGSAEPNATTPGSHSQHYAPRTPLLLVPHWPPDAATQGRLAPYLQGRCALLAWQPLPPEALQHAEHPLPRIVTTELLSATGDLEEAAHRLYGALRRLDALGVDLLLADASMPATGLGLALLDRLKRAASS